MSKLHPLHTPQWLSNYVLNSGEYPDITRMTGRTTVLALEAIVQALKHPGMAVALKDHHEPESRKSQIHFGNLVEQLVADLGLKHLHVELTTPLVHVIFERRTAIA